MNYLSKNIRYLRKSKKWSQEELAKRLGVKRSSIAAYERKNVRPRLDFIVGLSKMFNIRMSDLIEADIEAMGGLDKVKNGYNAPKPELVDEKPGKLKLDISDEESVKKFVERSIRIRKMLEGFKVFYKFKLESFESLSEDARRLTADIENFLLLMEHLLAHNDAIIRAISKKRHQL
jgi:transcriptional regulator with XRE-family HTH domain